MSVLSGPGYSVSKPSGRCAASGQPLTTGQKIVAVLVEVVREDGEELRRLDFSAQAWDEGHRPTQVEGSACRLFASWRTIVAAPDAKPKIVLDDAELLELFEQLDGQMNGQPDPKKQIFRYVLALLLIRRRVLRYEGERIGASGREMLVRRAGPKGSEADATPYHVADPSMDDAAIESAIEQIGALIGGTSAGATA